MSPDEEHGEADERAHRPFGVGGELLAEVEQAEPEGHHTDGARVEVQADRLSTAPLGSSALMAETTHMHPSTMIGCGGR